MSLPPGALASLAARSRRAATWLSLCLTVACGGPGGPTRSPSHGATVDVPQGAPPPEDPGAEASDGGGPEGGEEASGSSAGTPAPGASVCTRAEDCTLVADSCGRLHGVPLSAPAAPAASPCAPRKQARVRPQCVGGRCEATPIEDPDWYACKSAADCTLIEWPCGSPIAVARAHEAEAKKVAAINAAQRSCRHPPNASVTPTVACLFNACVTR